MRTVILGAGSAGIQLAKRLSESGKDVVIIERDPDTARIAANALDCLVVSGDASSPEILAQANLGDAEAFVALTGTDAINIVVCAIVAAEYPGVKRVARVRNGYFTRLAPAQRQFMGVDRFVNPDIEAAKAFLTLISQGADENIVRFGEEELMLRSVEVKADSLFADKPLKESRAAIPREFLVAAIERNDRTTVPSGDTVPAEGDVLYLLGDPKILETIVGKLDSYGKRFRKIVVSGGGPIGRIVAETLSGKEQASNVMGSLAKFLGVSRKREIIVVEKSMDVCKQLSRDLPNALILNRDIADEQVFEEEDLESADLFLATGPDQEENILAAARAKSAGIHRAMALAENSSYLRIAERLDIDGVLSLKSNVVTSIVEYLRGGNLKTLHSFWDRGIKILEFTVPAESPLAEKTVRELALPRGALILFVSRGKESLIPDGNARVASGDRLVIFSSMEAIKGVESIFVGGET